MSKTFRSTENIFAGFSAFAVLTAILFAFAPAAAAQKKDRIEIYPQILKSSIRNCKNYQLGATVFYLEPVYPPEAKSARIGGAVEVTVKVDETGKLSEIEKVAGNRFLQGAASDAALKIKFTPTVCDGAPIAAIGTITYNFIPFSIAQGYFVPSKIEDFTDIQTDSQNYEAIVDLTENYKIAFGYEDRKFYADAPLTKGDLVQFLRLTLDLLGERAKSANKTPAQIGLYNSFNTSKIASIDRLKDLDKKSPYLDSVRVLLNKYNIALANEKNQFDGNSPLSQNQLIEIWEGIFGADAVPVNFQRTDSQRIMTRGDFAVFLHESLGVLTYKILPSFFDKRL